MKTGKILSQTGENQGWRICRELGFDVLLAAHQHMEAENLQIGGTYTCQPPEKAAKFIRMNITADRGSVHAVSRLVPAGDQPLPAAMEAIAPTEKQLNEWLDTPVGRLDTPLPASDCAHLQRQLRDPTAMLHFQLHHRKQHMSAQLNHPPID